MAIKKQKDRIDIRAEELQKKHPNLTKAQASQKAFRELANEQAKDGND